MLRAVPRHNVNLTAEELQLVIRGALGQTEAPEGLIQSKPKQRGFSALLMR